MGPVSAFVVARNGSKRLPGKVMADVNGLPVLEHIYNRLIASPFIDEVVFVTSTLKSDDVIEKLTLKLNSKCFRGDPDDVLDRIYNASLETSSDLILEVGGDCPLIDPGLIRRGIEEYEEHDADFTSNAFFPPFTYPVGYDFSLIKKSALAKLHKMAKLKSERLQPFQFIVRHQEIFSIRHFTISPSYNHFRWTLDYQEDLDLLRAIFLNFKNSEGVFGYSEIISYLNENPHIVEINSKYADAIEVSTAWHTGSYVNEMHEDIITLLAAAKDMDNKADWSNARQGYENAESLVSELLKRIECFEAANSVEIAL